MLQEYTILTAGELVELCGRFRKLVGQDLQGTLTMDHRAMLSLAAREVLATRDFLQHIGIIGSHDELLS